MQATALLRAVDGDERPRLARRKPVARSLALDSSTRHVRVRRQISSEVGASLAEVIADHIPCQLRRWLGFELSIASRTSCHREEGVSVVAVCQRARDVPILHFAVVVRCGSAWRWRGWVAAIPPQVRDNHSLVRKGWKPVHLIRSCEMAASAGRVQWLFASFWATDTYVAGARPLFAAEAASLRR